MKQNIYNSLGLKQVINASGRVTYLGVSTISNLVAEAMISAARSYVNMHDLYLRSGEIISHYTGAEASLVTSSASAGIAISIAGVIAKDNLKHIRNLPDSDGLKNEIIIPKGHVVGFGAPISTMIKIGGGKMIEAGLVNQVTACDISDAITKNTAAIIYVKSHHSVQKGMPSLHDMVELAHHYQIPLIVDAAAEEDLRKYISIGADLVIYSGAKAFEAPSSGFITGKKELIQYAYQQYQGIGRPMKIGKESIIGLIKALEVYDNKNKEKAISEMHKKTKRIITGLNEIDSISAYEVQDEAGREIYRVEVKIAENNLAEFSKKLEEGNPAIYCRNNRISEGIITIDVRSLLTNEIELIIQRFKEILT